MRRSDEAIKADINSKDPECIQAAITDLKERIEKVDEFAMVPFGPEILIPFGDTVPVETQLDFLTILRKYRSFVPELSDEDRMHAMIAMVLRYAEGYVAFDVALKLKISAHPVHAVETAMQEIVRQGLLSPSNVKGAAYLVSRLLDGKDEVRRAILQNLRKWPNETPYQEVIEYIKPQLEPEELEFLKES
jgi:hypothetical protein